MTTPASEILCIGGSPRKGGNTDVILHTMEETFRRTTIPCDTVHLRDLAFSPCIGCEACRRDHVCRGCNDAMQELYPKIRRARGMVLVSPTHHYNITAWMKAFIDRMYCFYSFGTDSPRSWSSCLAGQDRLAALVAVCEQKDREDMGFTLEAMEKPMTAFGYTIVGEAAIFKIFEKAGIEAKPREMKKVTGLADTMAAAMKEKGSL